MHTVKMSTHSLGWKQFVKSLLTITLGPFNERHTRFFFFMVEGVQYPQRTPQTIVVLIFLSSIFSFNDFFSSFSQWFRGFNPPPLSGSTTKKTLIFLSSLRKGLNNFTFKKGGEDCGGRSFSNLFHSVLTECTIGEGI